MNAKDTLIIAREALCMPCDRWNAAQSQKVREAIAAIDASLLEGWAARRIVDAPPAAPSGEPVAPRSAFLRRADAVKLAQAIAMVYGRQDDAPDYLPRTVEQGTDFEPHGWVVMAIMQAYGDGHAHGYADGLQWMKERAAAPAPAEPAVPAWQSIETAPKCGREPFVVRGFNVTNENAHVRNYTTDPYCVWPGDEGGWVLWPHTFPPTHWTPLPAAPTFPKELPP